MEPLNPVAATMLPAAGAGKGCSPSDTGLHRRQQGFMKGAQHPTAGISGTEQQGGGPPFHSSQLMVDKLFTVPMEALGAVVGQLEPQALIELDLVLRGWLELP